MDGSKALEWLIETGVIPVVRIRDESRIMAVVEALMTGGINIIEITMSSPKPFETIDHLKSKYGETLLIGLGSVLNKTQAWAGIENGAEFIVSPIFNRSILDGITAQGKVSILGALTPTEIQRAYSAGTDIIKIFPATTFGPKYFSDILAPMPHLRLTPTGGVNLENAADFMDAGAVCVGVGTALLKVEIIQSEKWEALSQLAAEYRAEVDRGRQRRKL